MVRDQPESGGWGSFQERKTSDTANEEYYVFVCFTDCPMLSSQQGNAGCLEAYKKSVVMAVAVLLQTTRG